MISSTDFNKLLKTTGEVGTVIQVRHPINLVEGLYGVRLTEVVRFENGDTGQIISLTPDFAEVLVFGSQPTPIGTRVARTANAISIPVSDGILGTTINALGQATTSQQNLDLSQIAGQASIDPNPPGLEDRLPVTKHFETGVRLIDIMTPLGKGQRQLIIGQRKLDKSTFLRQAMASHIKNHGIVVYAAIAKQQAEILELELYLTKLQATGNTVLVYSLAADSSGLIYLTPYTAMSVAEYFKDQGREVLVIHDDLTMHAKHYRKISLLLERFPGRNSYPGDIFYVQSRIIERAGNFKKGSITALAVAETVSASISEFIPTNLMGMTDGHLYFDKDLYNQGVRPAIDPLLSVTRVGHQTQSKLVNSVSREVARLLVQFERTEALVHFGGQLSETAQATLTIGRQLTDFFNQKTGESTPVTVSLVLVIALLSGWWTDADTDKINSLISSATDHYNQDQKYRQKMNEILTNSKTIEEAKGKIQSDSEIFDTVTTSRLTQTSTEDNNQETNNK